MAPSAVPVHAIDGASPGKSSIGLTPAQLASYQSEGYLIIPDFLSPSTTTSLLSETHSLLSSFPLDTHPLTRFSTGQDAPHVGDDYFLTSGDKVRFFFEEGAFSPAGELIKPKERAINKIGHFLHGLSPPFRKATITKRSAAIARDIGFKDPRVLQSMVICKQPEIGGAVPPHQDSTFLYTNPPSAVGFWIALEDARVENGCLSFAKGSHRRTEVGSRFVRVGKGTGFQDVEGERWAEDVKEKREDKSQSQSHKEEEYTLGEVKAGSLVLIHGNLLHKSEKNLSQKGRIIYTFHMIEGGNDYDEKNWLLPPKEGFTKLLEEAEQTA